MKSIAVSTFFFSELFLAGTAVAADVYAPLAPEIATVQSESGWSFSFAPYFWAAGLSGTTSQFGLPTIDIDSSFSDIWDNLDFATMAIGEARYDRYGIFGDIIYTKLSNSAATPRGIVASSVDVSSKTFIGTFGASYSVLQSDAGHLDVVGGVRVWSVDTDLSFNGGILNGASRSDGATWVDGVVGFRGDQFITSHLYLAGWGLVGGGGANFDWDIAGGLGYRFNDRVSALMGYRALGVDYSNNGFVFDVVQQGPIFGLSMHF
jgi:hypothetical protein